MASAIPGCLYEQVLKAYGIDDTSMLVVSVGDPFIPAYASVTHTT